jgi:hypothetical protein
MEEIGWMKYTLTMELSQLLQARGEEQTVTMTSVHRGDCDLRLLHALDRNICTIIRSYHHKVYCLYITTDATECMRWVNTT